MISKTIRLYNFIIDTLAYFLILISVMVLFKNTIGIENIKWISCILYLLYYFLLEYFLGQTIGKMITRTEVATLSSNNNFYFFRILIRSITRFIPFDIISFIFTSRGLHDIFSKISVIKLRKN